SEHAADIVITDLRMPGMGGLEFVAALRERGSHATVIVMTAYGSAETALEVMKAGAYDYISKPFKPDEIVLTLRKAEERARLRRENLSLRTQLRRERSLERIASASPNRPQALRTSATLAPDKSTALLRGQRVTRQERLA